MTSISDTHTPDSRIDSSTSESAGAQPRSRHNSTALLMLPAPLSANRSPPAATSGSTPGLSQQLSDEVYQPEPTSASSHRLVSPVYSDQYADPSATSYPAPQPRYPSMNIPFDGQVSRSGGNTPVLRNSTVSSHYPGETHNPFRASVVQPLSAGYEDPQIATTYSPEPEDPFTLGRTRGVALSDDGPVPGPDGVRRVRNKRASTQPPQQNRYSRQSVYLPPGAAPPQ
jgi:chitin synthase